MLLDNTEFFMLLKVKLSADSLRIEKFKILGGQIILETLTTLLQMNINNGDAQKHNPQNHANPNKMIAMCYVPMQVWENLYDDDTAYHVGTIFPSLNKPFLGGGK